MDLDRVPRGTLNVVTAISFMVCAYFFKHWVDTTENRWESALAQLNSLENQVIQLNDTSVSFVEYAATKDKLLQRSQLAHEKIEEAIHRNEVEIAKLKK